MFHSRKLLVTAITLVLSAAAVPAAIADPPEPEPPIRVLVFSKPYGFSHTPSIEAGAAYLSSLTGEGEFDVVNTTDPNDLLLGNLSTFDVLVWNNSTGEVPLSPEAKTDLLNWVREGHGFVGIHSAADSNYTWPEFSELTGGYFNGHWFRFGGGGLTPDPTRLKLIKEDPSNPLMHGVPASYDSFDETYKWQVDPRTDVHVLMSMDNTSIIYGGLYDYHAPLAWCRPFGEGRTYYTNLGHDAALWSDAVYLKMIGQAMRYTGGRLDADCSVPTDPGTGVDGSERMEAVWADEVVGGSSQSSTYSGGMAVLTRIVPGEASLTWHDVDLEGVSNIDVFATAQTIAAPGTFLVAGTTPQQRISPASGGTVEIHADSADGPLLGSVTIPPAPGLVNAVNQPAETAALRDATGPVATWNNLTTSISAQEGVHDLVLTFPVGPLNTALATAAPGSNFVGSVGWIRLGR